jgi:hypothetical protein
MKRMGSTGDAENGVTFARLLYSLEPLLWSDAKQLRPGERHRSLVSKTMNSKSRSGKSSNRANTGLGLPAK